MVGRTIPISRRLRASQGQIVLVGAWLGAALLAVLLAFAQDMQTGGVAVAVHRAHPVLAPESGDRKSVV